MNSQHGTFPSQLFPPSSGVCSCTAKLETKNCLSRTPLQLDFLAMVSASDQRQLGDMNVASREVEPTSNGFHSSGAGVIGDTWLWSLQSSDDFILHPQIMVQAMCYEIHTSSIDNLSHKLQTNLGQGLPDSPNF